MLLPFLLINSLQVLEGLNKVFLELSLFKAKKAQLLQPFFIGDKLKPFDHLCGLFLNLLQQFHIFLALGFPGLDTTLQVGPYKGRVKGPNTLPLHAGHPSFAATRETVGLPHYECTLMAHSRFLSTRTSKSLSTELITGMSSSPSFVFMSGVALTQVHHLAFGLVELRRFL